MCAGKVCDNPDYLAAPLSESYPIINYTLSSYIQSRKILP